MRDEQRLGRAAFLGVTAVGLSSLWWGRSAWDAGSGLIPSGVGAVLPQPTSGWRIYTVAPTMPRIDPAAYRLRVDGLVRRPVSLTLADLRTLPAAAQVSDFHCVTGWSVSNVHWGGVRLSDLLERVQPGLGAHAVRFTSAEIPYVDDLTLDQAKLSDVLLAYEMDGKPLPRPHGAPVRLVMPEMYGYKSVKWVNRLELTKVAPWGYWEQNGYDVDAWLGRSNGY